MDYLKLELNQITNGYLGVRFMDMEGDPAQGLASVHNNESSGG